MDSTVSLSASQAQAAAEARNNLIEETGGDFTEREMTAAVTQAVDARTAHEVELHSAQEQTKLDNAPGLAPEAPAEAEGEDAPAEEAPALEPEADPEPMADPAAEAAAGDDALDGSLDSSVAGSENLDN